MLGTAIYEGTVMVDKNSGKVYIVNNNSVIDVNSELVRSIGEAVQITVTAPPAKNPEK